MDFHVVGFSKVVEFLQIDGYEVENSVLGNLMIEHSLNRLREEKVFGSGWAINPKDYPHFFVEENYTIIYDSTHINPDKLTYD